MAEGVYTIGDQTLSVGMWLKNTGKGAIPVYNGTTKSDAVLLNIQPGEMIGQIHDFKYDDGESWVVLSSGAITSANPWYDKLIGGALVPLGGTVMQYFTDKTTSLLSLYGGVRLTDLQANVSQDSVAAQAKMMAADPEGNNILKSIIKQTVQSTAQMTGETVKAALTGLTTGAGGSNLLLWGILGLGALYAFRTAEKGYKK